MSFSAEQLKPLSDIELIALYKKDDDKKFVAELYKRYTHLVLGMCIHYFKDRDIAKDVVIEIFEKLFVELKKREIENFRGWLTFVVRNHCISELRKIQTRLKQNLEYQYELKQNVDSEDKSSLEQEAQIQQLEKALVLLNPVQKKCVELFYLKNMSYAQIVGLTGYSIGEVKSYLQNGKRNLKLIISQFEDFSL